VYTVVCVCASAKSDKSCEPIYLSKEEVGEILVRETERRRFRCSAETPQLSQLKPAVPLNTANADHIRLKCDDVLSRQTCSLRDGRVNIPNAGDEKPKSQMLSCQPAISRHIQQNDQMKTTKALQTICSNVDLPDRTTVCHTTSTTVNTTTVPGRCTPTPQENVDNIHQCSNGDCDMNVVNTDSFAAPPNSDGLALEAGATCAKALRAPGMQKKKKTVTFSDNIELVASASDVADTVDYMAYVASIGRQAVSKADSLPSSKNMADRPNSSCSDCDADSSDEMNVENCVTSSSQVRCSLCRQKWVELTDTYCSDCSFYLSKLQMSN